MYGLWTSLLTFLPRSLDFSPLSLLRPHCFSISSLSLSVAPLLAFPPPDNPTDSSQYTSSMPLMPLSVLCSAASMISTLCCHASAMSIASTSLCFIVSMMLTSYMASWLDIL